jgi:ABC-2 type transport system permease protein
LILPAGPDLASAAGERVVVQGYVCWAKRNDVADLRLRLEGMLSKALGRPVSIQVDGNVLYPPADGVLFLGIATVNAVLIMLAMGIFLVPSLLLDEKESKTLQALLVSPASIGQVVAGKALAGAFYILVSAVVMFAISWAEVIHWDIVLLFVISSGFFSVAVGLTLGSLFSKQQDMAGWITVVLLLLTGAVLVAVLGVELPSPLSGLLPWVPSVALAEVCRASFSGPVAGAPVLARAGAVLIESLPLYSLVIWRVRHSDR